MLPLLLAAGLAALTILLWHRADQEEVRQSATENPGNPLALSEGASSQTPGTPSSARNIGWELVDPASVNELPPYKEVVPGRALVRILNAIEKWDVGDQIFLSVPQLGSEFDGVIETTTQDADGNRTYLGMLREPDGRRYRFLVTAGPKNTFAHIGTSRGTFELVATGPLGWLMPTVYMDQHVDYSQPDYYIPEQAGRRENDDAS